MRTHLALLRGINVGGRHRVAMADLRALATRLGHTDVATYIQSGNLVFSTRRRDAAALAAQLERAVAEQLGVPAGVVVLDRAGLAAIVAALPFPVSDPRTVHAIVHQQPRSTAQIEAVAAAVRQARERGSRDDARVVGSVCYLHTPDGFGRSELAALLTRAAGTPPAAAGTARNWATVLALVELLGG